MTGYFRDLRLMPIAVVASACLFVLIAADLLLGRGLSATSDDAPMKEADTGRGSGPTFSGLGRRKCSTFRIPDRRCRNEPG
jgi:hypothetical protein